MRLRRNRSMTRAAALSTAAVIFVLSAAGVAHAQLPPTYGRPSPIERDMRYRDWVLDQLKRQRKVSEKELQLAYEQIQRDFKRMQVINNDFLREAAKAEGEIDYRLVYAGTEEMQKCAERLRSNLFLPEAEAGKSSSPDYSELPMKTLLSLLDTLVVSFVKNPMFKSTEVIDLKLAAGARKTLDAVIRFSGKVRKKAKLVMDAKK